MLGIIKGFRISKDLYADREQVIFWLQPEASVAVIVVSISAFRALFVAQKASKYNQQRSPGHNREDSQAKLWTSRMRQEKSLPGVSYPRHTGVDTQITNDTLNGRHEDPSLGGMELPLEGTGIMVTKDLSSEEKVR